ncbi:hypothetical protein SESBI_30784 [Sesbania bispinosa]|nr:hypothetical protein SESBI_30784 [Sesbania bispinosa]
MAAICYKVENHEMYVHRCYRGESYELCHGQIISPINGQSMCPKTDQGVMYPLTYKRGPGRPKKLRRREPDEDPTPTKLKRTNIKYACGFCHSYGHNNRKCILKPTEEPPPPAGQENATMDGNTAPQT